MAPKLGACCKIIAMKPNRYVPIIEAATSSAFRPGNAVTLLQNGDEIFPAMLAAIRGAQESVEFLSYVFWRSRIANDFADALCERARAGIPVRLLVDALGGASMSTRMVWQMERAGIKVGWFRPARPPHLRKLNHRTHRKLLLVDGHIGFTGGVGIADVWLGSAQGPGHWRETHCRIDGPACTDLFAGFADSWQESTGESLTPPVLAPVAGKVEVQTIVSTAGGRPTPIERLLDAVFAAAQERLWITTAYFVPGDSVVQALAAAARRGVDVRLLVNGRHTDHRVTMFAGRATYQPLLDSGVKLYEYQKTMHHAKIITADSAWATLGSTNLDARSLFLNDELNISFTDPKLVQALDRQFLADLKDAHRIQRTHWYQRGRLARIVESSSNILRNQL
jgi:cardiolipin synthase